MRGVLFDGVIGAIRCTKVPPCGKVGGLKCVFFWVVVFGTFSQDHVTLSLLDRKEQQTYSLGVIGILF